MSDFAAPAVEQGFFHARDGTRLAYQAVGRGPWLVLANGLGGTFPAWRPIYERLADRYRFLCWDYRGLYGSDVPSDPDRLGVEVHADDMMALLDRFGVDRAVFLGWSMGTQVNLELYRSRPELFEGLIFLNGTSGRPFETVFGRRFMATVIPPLLKVMEAAAPALSAASRQVAGRPELIPLLQALGLVGKTLDRQVFSELSQEFASLDFRFYARLLDALGRHDASDVLEEVNCPTLIISGSKDVMTPLDTARRICRVIPVCRLEVIEGASHYAAVEFPDQVCGFLQTFLDGIGYGGNGPGKRMV